MFSFSHKSESLFLPGTTITHTDWGDLDSGGHSCESCFGDSEDGHCPQSPWLSSLPLFFGSTRGTATGRGSEAIAKAWAERDTTLILVLLLLHLS